MSEIDDDLTSSTLLREIADWENHPAWGRFIDTYDPYLRRWCRGFGLDGDASDEVCQRIWWELARRIRTFEYDPSGSFRGWLRLLCHSRVLNYLQERRNRPLLGLDDRDSDSDSADRGGLGQLESDPSGTSEDETATDAYRHPLLNVCEEVQKGVREKVQPHTWEAFWLVAVYGWSVEQTAESLKMSRAAVYAASERVAHRLRNEGELFLKSRPADG